ncbi:heparan-alpha-glucosaminide N-acetyltransferase domain-containing protein [Formosa sp. PL04]|uniref:heparan-alpha-glucosaminide N-acetyltransferase domain-containing protein n=1 Tax=Formosa sp. PL04 TaxID=3081755 RepID=UPI0029822839|nr:heparan-alpha-glucosaminide N-acetyltransferase domain-containing protein [Formosa sp. PL04]MDW5289804.1 heparan-alpha-glucosaminide N-acetyltransferase domain-containing protein [Formosa sp. PL04]
MKDNRLYFLDAVRLYAILMMLQGHFIDGLLNPVYKSTSYFIYNIWSDLRGNTAPIFFTITGLVVMFLLKKAEAKGLENFRIKKSLKRGISLILIGYILRIPIFHWLSGHFNSYFLVIDVLQIIGISLLLLNGLYILFKSKPNLLTFILTAIGTLIFISEPLYRNLTLPYIPDVLANYFTIENGSVFTVFPWFGYVAYGAVLGLVFNAFQTKKHFRIITISSFIIGGLCLTFLSSSVLELLFDITHIKLFYQASIYNYLFSRLGSVCITFGIFYALESYLKHPLISKLGNNTLSIYVVHFIILYGSFTGIGLYQYLHNELEPWPAIFGTFAFVISVSFIVLHEGKIKAFLNANIRKALLFIKINTADRIKLYRR